MDEAQEDSKHDTDRELMERILANQYLIRNMLIEIFGKDEEDEEGELEDEEDEDDEDLQL